MDAAVAQIIVAIIGLVGSIVVPIITRLLEKDKSPSLETAPSSEVKQGSFPRIAIRPLEKRPRSFLDLSIFLMYGTFFSGVLADALFISGRIPSLNLEVLGLIFVITLIITGILILAWYWHRGEVTIGILSITTLVVLLLSPGGPIFPANDEGEAGPGLLLPVFVLVLLATASVIYLFGNPLTKRVKSENLAAKKQRKRTIVFLCGLFLVSALFLGLQLVTDVYDDEKIPKKFTGDDQQTQLDNQEKFTKDDQQTQLDNQEKFIKDDQQIQLANQVLKKFKDKKLQDRGLFYQLASEIALSSYYQNNYFTVLSSSNSFSSQTSLSSEESEQTSLQSKTEKKSFLETFQTYFKNISQIDYLDDRLLWIHPTARLANGQVEVSLPGITSEERLKALTVDRNIYALSLQPNRVFNFLQWFTYDQTVQSVYENVPNIPTIGNFLPFTKKTRSALEKYNSDRSEQTWKKLFPDLRDSTYKERLLQQLALPISDESFLAYSSYQDVALLYQETSNQLIQTEKIKSAQKYFNQLTPLTPQNQQAFIQYVADDNTPSDENDNLNDYKILLKLAKADPSISLSDSPTATSELETRLQSSSTQGAVSSEIEEIASKIENILSDNPDEKTEFINLLKTENSQIPIKELLNSQTFEFIKYIDRELGKESKEKLFSILRDPVTPSILAIADRDTYEEQKEWLSESLKDFSQLTLDNQEEILHRLALGTYAYGDFSPSPQNLLIFQAQSLSPVLGFICAFMLMSPLVLSAIALGLYAGNKLVERDRTRLLIATEQAKHSDLHANHTIGTPVELQGREDFLKKLSKLAQRGWSTIAVVGRRGVGKSRILYELYQNKPTDSLSQTYGVRVWIAAPSQYAEEDFIESTLEQLALNTEQAVAEHLGAKSLAVRQLETSLTQSGAIVLGIAVIVLIVLLAEIIQRIDRPEIIITCFPISLVIVASAICLAIHLVNLQPLDLSSWLESERAQSSHTVLLYRRVQETFKYLRSRKTSKIGTPIEAKGIFSILLSFLFFYTVFSVALFIALFIFTYSVTGGILFIGIIFLIGIATYRNSKKGGRIEQGNSLMSLIGEYRNFAITVVERLEKEALGEQKKNVMICIDELDKIIELNELRSFLRRMKGIFEVPGVYYYLSLSEDALAALYLGSAEGKNEVDSSLDHIVRVPPLSWDKSKTIVKNYLEARQFSPVGPKMIDVLVALSFGVPRDLLRRCDELMACQERLTPQALVFQKRQEQVEIATDSHQWSKQQYQPLIQEDAIFSARAARQSLEKLLKNEDKIKLAEGRIIGSICILCYIEFACNLEESKRHKFLEELSNLGYAIIFSPLLDIANQMEEIDASFLSKSYQVN